MCNEGWYVRLGGGCVRLGGTVWNTLKWSGTEKRGGETKILKGGKQSQCVGAMKKAGVAEAGTPLETMMLDLLYHKYNTLITTFVD